MPKKIHKTRGAGCSFPSPSQVISLGEYRIVTFHDGSAWILHNEGEGMQTTTAKLAKAIEAFWRKEF